jgi:phenylacetate-CoA ligase
MLLPAGDAVFRQGMMKRLRFVEQAQWWDPERTAAWRTRELRKLLAIVYREIPLYRELMDQAGVKPEHIRTISDLSRLPIVTKTQMRERFPDGVIRSTGLPVYDTKTSGSTGRLFTIREDAASAGVYRASFMLALEWAGWQPGEPHIMTGVNFERSRDRRIKDFLLQCHYMRVDDLSDAQLDRHLDTMESHRIEHLWGYPGQLTYMARRAEKRGWKRPMKTIVTWGEMLYPSQREEIEAVFGRQVTDTYGCGEGFQISAQCGQGTYHVHELDVIVEYVDDRGEPVPQGAAGHLVITRLHPGPMPFVRYMPGDLATASLRQRCPCGRHWAIMDSIQGRATDTIITPSGNRIVGHIFNRAVKSPEIDSFQIVQKDVNSMTLRLLLLPGHEYTPALGKKLIDNLRRNGADLDIRIEPVKELPIPPSGKHRFIVSEVVQR